MSVPSQAEEAPPANEPLGDGIAGTKPAGAGVADPKPAGAGVAGPGVAGTSAGGPKSGAWKGGSSKAAGPKVADPKISGPGPDVTRGAAPEIDDVASTTPRRPFLRLRPFRLDPGNLLAQIIAVALGVMIGFGVPAWNERAHQQTLSRETLNNIVNELKANQAGMRVVMKEHAKSAAMLTSALAAPRKSMKLTQRRAERLLRAGAKFRENIPLSIAWQIAQNDPGLTRLAYQDRYNLAWIYQLQSTYYQAEERYRNALLTVVEPPSGNYYLQMLDLAIEAQAVVAAERQLDRLYTAVVAEAQNRGEIASSP